MKVLKKSNDKINLSLYKNKVEMNKQNLLFLSIFFFIFACGGNSYKTPFFLFIFGKL
jgi:hypothetical protein